MNKFAFFNLILLQCTMKWDFLIFFLNNKNSKISATLEFFKIWFSILIFGITLKVNISELIGDVWVIYIFSVLHVLDICDGPQC